MRKFLYNRVFFSLKLNKPRTAKVGAISKAQNLKGGPFGFVKLQLVAKNLKKLKGTLWRHEKISQKKFLM